MVPLVTYMFSRFDVTAYLDVWLCSLVFTGDVVQATRTLFESRLQPARGRHCRQASISAFKRLFLWTNSGDGT